MFVYAFTDVFLELVVVDGAHKIDYFEWLTLQTEAFSYINDVPRLPSSHISLLHLTFSHIF